MMLEFAYDSSVDPPAPIVAVTVADGGGENALVFPAFLDTGADRTVVPSVLVAALELTPAEDQPGLIIRTVAGTQAAQTYVVALTIGERDFSAIAPAIGDELIVGRDVLNELVVRFDGPARYLAIENAK